MATSNNGILQQHFRCYFANGIQLGILRGAIMTLCVVIAILDIINRRFRLDKLPPRLKELPVDQMCILDINAECPWPFFFFFFFF